MSINLPFKKNIYIFFQQPNTSKKNIKISKTVVQRMLTIYFQLPHPPPKKHIYNNLKPSPLDRQYKNQLPANTSILPSQYIFNPHTPQKNPQHSPPPKKKCQRHGSSSSSTYSSRYIFNCPIPLKKYIYIIFSSLHP